MNIENNMSNLNNEIKDLSGKLKDLEVKDAILTEKQKEVDKIFTPNKKGESEWIMIDKIKKSKLLWSNNGNCRHGKFFGDNRYIWEKYPSVGKIEKLKINGFDKNKLDTSKRPISTDIKNYYKKKPCVFCGKNNELVCDHKNDLYNDKRVLTIKTQKKSDFQSLCNACNLLKREANVKERKNNKLYSAKNIPKYKCFPFDFPWEKKLFDIKDINCKKDTFWYDPKEFHRKLYIFMLMQPFLYEIKGVNKFI